MEGTKIGLKDTTEVCDLVVDIAKVIVEAGKDGKVTMDDVTLLFRLIPVIGPAVTGIKNVPAEIKDMDADEANALISHVAERLSLENAKAQEIVEKSLKCAVSLFDLVKTITA